MQIRAQQLRPLNIIPPIQFFVNGMCAVGGGAHGQEKDVFARRLLECDGDGDAVGSEEMLVDCFLIALGPFFERSKKRGFKTWESQGSF